eukprot:CAMPEP_0180130782 /NCGR_PEP_ID=MMETSP0986-20121125/8054_1 /TAXON_ID=697907 /ORGANISM="non described non described, Strain CCMP2293" /LENGTH=322 /DNA_ID=CAMNT_0022070583 /DNA_START=151 /DNA_END=1119 /DNA_ORIENTATION=+
MTFAYQSVTDNGKAVLASKAVMVTGANSGCGWEACRQLAVAGFGRVVMACRNQGRADDAKKKLEDATGKAVFEVLMLDTESKGSVRAAVAALPGKVDCLILNAGKVQTEAEARVVNTDGIQAMCMMHVIGPMLLTELLRTSAKLAPDATVIYVASETTRGDGEKGTVRPRVPQDKDGVASMVAGEFRALETGEYDEIAEYGMSKLTGTLCVSGLSRKHPGFNVFTVSPGMTQGTQFGGDYVGAPIMELLKTTTGHSMEFGSDRYLQLVMAPEKFASGVFYASEPGVHAGGAMQAQTGLHPALGNAVLCDMLCETLTAVAVRD